MYVSNISITDLAITRISSGYKLVARGDEDKCTKRARRASKSNVIDNEGVHFIQEKDNDVKCKGF